MTREEAIEANKILDYAKKVNGVAYKALKEALKTESCEDTISRHAAIDAIENHRFSVKDVEQEDDVKWGLAMALEAIEQLPSVTPTQKIGQWRSYYDEYLCLNCGSYSTCDYDYCPNCGLKMETNT